MKLGPETPAVISGGASGLGAATARMLAGAGAPVTLIDIDRPAGEALAAELGGIFLHGDVTDPEQIADALSRAAHAHGPARIAVACAGIAPGARTVGRDGQAHDPGLFRRVIDINLMGSFHLASQAAAAMAPLPALTGDGERGLIALTASIAAFEAQIGQIAYGASKGAIAGMVLPMARDLARDGIRVNAIAPGMFRTPMVAGLPQDVQDSLGGKPPFPARFGDPREFAMLVCQMAENPMINGTTIRLDGAIRLEPK